MCWGFTRGNIYSAARQCPGLAHKQGQTWPVTSSNCPGSRPDPFPSREMRTESCNKQGSLPPVLEQIEGCLCETAWWLPQEASLPRVRDVGSLIDSLQTHSEKINGNSYGSIAVALNGQNLTDNIQLLLLLLIIIVTSNVSPKKALTHPIECCFPGRPSSTSPDEKPPGRAFSFYTPKLPYSSPWVLTKEGPAVLPDFFCC